MEDPMPHAQHQLFNRLFTIVSGLGFVIAFAGLGLDLLPGSSPGISFPQLLLIGVGLILMGVGLILRKQKNRQTLSSNILKNLTISLFMFIIIIVILEGVLIVVDTPIRYSAEISESTLQPSDYWTCDDIGCRYNVEAVQVACTDGTISNRHCVINDAGFHDSQQFIEDETLEQASLRVFTLGDSFTFGASAKLGYSWVETLESNLPYAIIWNTGMPGTGNNQALEVLKSYAPIMKPDIVLLGFYLNDFEDNIYPLDQFFRGGTSEGKVAIIRQYQYQGDGTYTKIKDPLHLLYRLYGVEPPRNSVEQFLGNTHLGSLLLNTIESIQRMFSKLEGTSFEHQVAVTREYLQEIKKFSESLNSQFMILLIPETEDLTQPSIRYTTAIRLFDELDIPHINPIDLLNTDKDYERPPNVHWSTEGHQKVGKMLTRCLKQFQIDNTQLDC
jgi:hypothetical protein